MDITQDRLRLTPHRRGRVANLLRANDSRGSPRILKVPRSAQGNQLLSAEADALRELAALTTEHRWLAPFYPDLLDSLRRPAHPGRINVLNDLSDGYFSLAEVLARQPAGLDARDYAWIHRRLLKALAGAHLCGLVHGAVLPENVLIQPAQHGVVLAGWTFSVPTGSELVAVIAPLREHYPPEVKDGDSVTPALDVYMANTLMMRMLAANSPAPMITFARGCLQRLPVRRPSAADLISEYDELLDNLYGPRQFRPFPLSA